MPRLHRELEVHQRRPPVRASPASSVPWRGRCARCRRRAGGAAGAAPRGNTRGSTPADCCSGSPGQPRAQQPAPVPGHEPRHAAAGGAAPAARGPRERRVGGRASRTPARGLRRVALDAVDVARGSAASQVGVRSPNRSRLSSAGLGRDHGSVSQVGVQPASCSASASISSAQKPEQRAGVEERLPQHARADLEGLGHRVRGPARQRRRARRVRSASNSAPCAARSKRSSARRGRSVDRRRRRAAGRA